MTTIRPTLPATLSPQRNIAPNDGVSAAQRAFFQTALTNAASPASPQPVAKTQPSAGGDQPARTLRPGSLIDIRV